MSPLENLREFENENFGVVIIDGEKHLLYIGDDTADMAEASIRQCWPEEKSVWDDI